MTFFARIFWFLFWLLVISWSVALLRRLVAWMLRAPRGSAETGTGNDAGTQLSRRLVRDPVCGVHVAEVLAVPLRTNGEVLHFCSAQCRDAYVNTARPKVVNG